MPVNLHCVFKWLQIWLKPVTVVNDRQHCPACMISPIQPFISWHRCRSITFHEWLDFRQLVLHYFTSHRNRNRSRWGTTDENSGLRNERTNFVKKTYSTSFAAWHNTDPEGKSTFWTPGIVSARVGPTLRSSTGFWLSSAWCSNLASRGH